LAGHTESNKPILSTCEFEC